MLPGTSVLNCEKKQKGICDIKYEEQGESMVWDGIPILLKEWQKLFKLR